MRALLIILSLVFGMQSFGQTTLQPEQLQQDFLQLKKELKQRNRGLYNFQTEEEFQQRFETILQQLNEPKSDLEFYSIVKQFIVPVGERHLSVVGFGKQSTIPKQFENKKFKLLPLAILFPTDSTAFILRNVSKDTTIQLPSQILSINNQPIEQIRATIANYIPKDYKNSTWENWEISATFPTNYFFHIDTTSTFSIQWKDSLQNIQNSNLKGVSATFYRDSITTQSKQILETEAFLPSLRTDYYPEISTGYLKIGTFSEQTVSDNNGGFITYKEIVKRFFTTVNENNFSSVIIDLRNNTGGKVHHVEYLLSYLVNNTQKQEIFESERKRKYWWGNSNYKMSIQRRNKNFFTGDIYILTNGGSYSASVMVATFAKDLANATIVGVEAGGRYDGTTAGRFKTIELKHSHLLVRIPEASYNYFVSSDNFTSIQPDIAIAPNMEDYFSYSKDYQLQELLRLISKQ